MIKFLQTLVFFVFLATSLNVFSQVAIGTTAPDLSSILDVQSSNRGILIPRVSLTGTTDASTISNSAESLLVYNTATQADVTPGFYYWDGVSRWLRFTTSASQPAVMMRSFTAPTVGDDNAVFNFPNVLFNNISGSNYSNVNNRIVLPRGIYKVESDLRLRQKETVSWSIRLNGNGVASSIPGSAKVVSDNSDDTNGSKQFAIVEVTANTGAIDFIVTQNTGFLRTNVIPEQCFVVITKIG